MNLYYILLYFKIKMRIRPDKASQGEVYISD